MIFLSMVVALCACVQGMDESVVSGAGLFYPTALNIAGYTKISTATLEGLISSSPYLAAGAIGCKTLCRDRIVTISDCSMVQVGSQYH